MSELPIGINGASMADSHNVAADHVDDARQPGPAMPPPWWTASRRDLHALLGRKPRAAGKSPRSPGTSESVAHRKGTGTAGWRAAAVLLGVAGAMCGLEVAVLVGLKAGIAVAGLTAVGGFGCLAVALGTSEDRQYGSRFAWVAALVNVPGLVAAALLVLSLAGP
jgi:hypothetical protein